MNITGITSVSFGNKKHARGGIGPHPKTIAGGALFSLPLHGGRNRGIVARSSRADLSEVTLADTEAMRTLHPGKDPHVTFRPRKLSRSRQEQD